MILTKYCFPAFKYRTNTSRFRIICFYLNAGKVLKYWQKYLNVVS